MDLGIVGGVSTAVCAAVGAAALARTVRLRRGGAEVNGVSAGSATLVLATAALWGVYGAATGAWWVVAMSSWDGALYAALLIALRRAWIIAAVAAGIVTSATLPPVAVAGAAVIIGAAMFVPQAYRLWRVRRTDAAGDYSPVAASALLIGNAGWVWYGALLSDPLLTWPPVVHTATAAAMLWMVAGFLVRHRAVEEHRITSLAS